MSRLLVLTTPELAAGYRLAGVAALEVASSARGGGAARRSSLEHEDGVIAVHAPFFHALDRTVAAATRRAARSRSWCALPAGVTTEQAEDRRERLLQMLRQAVGYEITFGDERGPMTAR